MEVVVGLNCAHDASVCVCVDGKILVALSEDRITRRKHASGFPANALKAALRELGPEVAAGSFVVVVNQHPPADYLHEIHRFLPGVAAGRIFVNPSHHLLHALYAIATAGFDDTAVLVLDGSGYSYGEYLRRQSPLIQPGAESEEAQEAWSLFKHQGGRLSVESRRWELWVSDKDNRFRFPSLGHMYSLAAQILFGQWTDAGKVMGLAAFGDAGALDLDIVHLEEGGIRVDVDWIAKLPLLERRQGDLSQNVLARNLAARVQGELEKGVLHLCRLAQRSTAARHLCLTGGVALNTVCNSLVRGDQLFDDVFVTPAASDAGVAIGSAAYGIYRSAGRIPDFSGQPEFLGTEFTGAEIETTLAQQKGIEYRYVDGPVPECIGDLLSGRVVGWFEGRAEFGPRALGHRSILADPRLPDVKDRINAAVKFREAFRPFAASILAERVSEYFATGDLSPFMLFIAAARPHTRQAVPAVIHADGTCRLQTVSASYPGGLRKLLEAFAARTGIPLLLNTSLNLAGEPLCERPEDAVRTLVQSGLDVLYLDGYRVEKKNRRADSLSGLIPALFATTRLVRTSSVQAQTSTLAVSETRLEVGRGPTTRRHTLNDDEAFVLGMVDGRRTVQEIANALEGSSPGLAVERILLRLNDAGAIFFGPGSGDPGAPPDLC